MEFLSCIKDVYFTIGIFVSNGHSQANLANLSTRREFVILANLSTRQKGLFQKCAGLARLAFIRQPGFLGLTRLTDIHQPGSLGLARLADILQPSLLGLARLAKAKFCKYNVNLASLASLANLCRLESFIHIKFVICA
jgi:hypothetical protein